MALATEFELVRQARSDVESVRRMLLVPTLQTMSTAVPLLQGAAAKLAWLERRLSGAGLDCPAKDGLRPEMLAIKRSVGEVQALVGQASEFFVGWASLVGLAAQDYGPANCRAASRRLTVEG